MVMFCFPMRRLGAGNWAWIFGGRRGWGPRDGIRGFLREGEGPEAGVQRLSCIGLLVAWCVGMCCARLLDGGETAGL